MGRGVGAGPVPQRVAIARTLINKPKRLLMEPVGALDPQTRWGMQGLLIENTFRLLADQIVTMRSPQELSGQLDELIDGVEAVRQTTRETDRLLQAVER